MWEAVKDGVKGAVAFMVGYGLVLAVLLALVAIFPSLGVAGGAAAVAA